MDALLRAMQAHDIDGDGRRVTRNRLCYDDRRRLTGNPLPDLRTAVERILEQYTQFEGRMLAVRG